MMKQLRKPVGITTLSITVEPSHDIKRCFPMLFSFAFEYEQKQFTINQLVNRRPQTSHFSYTPVYFGDICSKRLHVI